MADPYFLSEFYKNIRRYRYTTGNDVGTHTVLSIEMGIPYFHSGPTPRYRDLTGNDPDFNYGVACGDGVVDIGRDRRPMVSELCRLLPDPDGPIAISADLQAFVSYLHGTDEPLDRGALRRLIVEAYLTATPAARVAVENVWNDEDLQRHLGLSRLAPDAPATHAEAASN